MIVYVKVWYLGWFWLLLEARGRASLGPRCLLMVMSLIPPAPGLGSPSSATKKSLCLRDEKSGAEQFWRHGWVKLCLQDRTHVMTLIHNLLKNLLMIMLLTHLNLGPDAKIQGLPSVPDLLGSVCTRAGKSKSLIRWKRLKGGKRREKAEKANSIYN